MFELSGKTIVVSGASSGIGRSICSIASKLNARLIMIGRDEEKLQGTLKGMSGEGHRYIVQDMIELNALNEKLTNLFDELSCQIDGFVHSAGKEMTKPFSMTEAQDFRDLFELNLITGLEIVRLITKRKYLSANGASYVFISSLMGRLGSVGISPYCASKSAISATVKSLALEYARRKCRFNSVMPGYVDTALLQKSFKMMSQGQIETIYNAHPLGIGTPQDVANLVVYLLSDCSKWMTGQNIIIDGGYSAK